MSMGVNVRNIMRTKATLILIRSRFSATLMVSKYSVSTFSLLILSILRLKEMGTKSTR